MPSSRLLLGLILLASLFPLSCAKKADNTIKIGLAAVQTGPDGQIGKTMLQGSQIAIDEWNARGGVLGKKIVTVWRDDEGRPDKAVTVAQELVNEGVVAVIGHFNSGCTLPASAIYSRNNVLQITMSNNSKITEQGFPALFRIDGKDSQQGDVIAPFLLKKLGLTRLAIFHDKTAFGEHLAEQIQKSFIAGGGQVVLLNGISKTELDFRSNIALLKNSPAQALYWAGIYGQLGPLIVQMRQAGLTIPVASCSAVLSTVLLNALGNNTNDFYLTYGPDFPRLPAARTFINDYHAKYGPEGSFSGYGYAAMQVLLDSIQKAGTADASLVAPIIHNQTFPTILGPIAFNTNGDRVDNEYAIWTIKNGAFVPLPQ